MTRMALTLAALLTAILLTSPAIGVELDDAQQRRAVALFEQLRCMVCQNQSIADSGAELAQDLRRQVREQIVRGRTDAEIKAYMAERYGDYVLYSPPMKASTLLLWCGPALLLALGVLSLLAVLRARRSRADPPALSEEERAKAAALLCPIAPGETGMPTHDETGTGRA